MEDNRETMAEDPVCYTTAYEIRIVKTLCAFIAANGIILLSFTLNRLQAAGLGVVHGYIMGMILSYQIFGISCKKRNRRIIIALGMVMLGFLAALDWRFETVFILMKGKKITTMALLFPDLRAMLNLIENTDNVLMTRGSYI